MDGAEFRRNAHFFRILLENESVQVAHELLRDSALQLLPPITKRVLHACVARTLEGKYNDSHEATVLWDCADHWSQSGESEKALEFIKRCADHLTTVGRAAQALHLLGNARTFAKRPDEQAALLADIMSVGKAAGQWGIVDEVSQERSALSVAIGSTQSATELIAIEADWMIRLRAVEVVPRLKAFTVASHCSTHHRLDAAMLLLRVAHDLGDHGLAAEAFAEVEPIVGTDPHSYSALMLPIVYHTSFGDRGVALSLAQQVVPQIATLTSVGDRFRAVVNCGVALCILGAIDATIALFESYLEMAVRCGAKGWAQHFCANLCWTHLSSENFHEAGRWFDRMQTEFAVGLGAIFNMTHATNGIELALASGDRVLAEKRAAPLEQRDLGDSIRARAYLLGVRLRIQQLDPDFACSDGILREVLQLHRATHRLTSADSLTIAIGEALKRLGKNADGTKLILDYIERDRREWSPIPPTLKMLADHFKNLQPTC